MHTCIVSGIDAIRAEQWNAIAGDSPFLRHEFLHALEASRCVGPATGWEPHHVAIYADRTGNAPLLGAVPLYLKQHSYGEYVFDWAWASAYERHGGSYYPKLVAAVPFTPATGPRLLIAPDTDAPAVAKQLIAATRDAAEQVGASSLHWLFPSATDMDVFRNNGFLARTGCQFHWANAGYRDFDDFLATFTSHQRNNIRRERRRVREAGVSFDVLRGADITASWWDTCFDFYRTTVRTHGAIAYLSREFFHQIGMNMPDQTVLIVAKYGREPVGMAFGLRNAHTFYGRYWGGRRDIPGLHFETCYYTAIEYCINEKIARYEAGAQGEHKHARGFTPTLTYSAHWLRDPNLRRAVADFLERERGHVENYIDEMNEHAPFRTPSLPSH